MILKIKSLARGVLFFLCVPLQGQNLMQMKFDVLDEIQGLSSHWVTDIALHSTGFVWVATKNGLSRYDGHSFKKFRHKNPELAVQEMSINDSKIGKLLLFFKCIFNKYIFQF